MSNCVVTIEIKEFHPENLNFNTFSFIFLSELTKFEDEISYSNRNSIIHKVSPKKEIKYTIKITKAKSLIGITDFIIPYSVLLKKEETYTKLCQVTMTESIKRVILGNCNWLSDSLKLLIQATLQYIKKPSSLKQSHSMHRTEDNGLNALNRYSDVNGDDCDKPQLMPNMQKIHSDLDERCNFDNRISPLNNSMKGFVAFKKPMTCLSTSNKKSVSQHRSMQRIRSAIGKDSNSYSNKDKEKGIEKGLNEHYCTLIDTNRIYNSNTNKTYSNNNNNVSLPSTNRTKKSSSPTKNSNIIEIETIKQAKPFSIEAMSQSNDAQFHQIIDKYLNEIHTTSITMNTNKDKDNEAFILTKAKDIISKVMSIQTAYYNQINTSLLLNSKQRSEIRHYNEQYNSIMKQSYMLSKANASFDFTHSIANDLKSNRTQITKDSIPISNKEIHLYTSVFNSLSTKHHITEINTTSKQNKDERLLTSVLKTLLQSNSNVIKNLHQSMHKSLSHLITKYSYQYLINTDDLLLNAKGSQCEVLSQAQANDADAQAEEEIEKNLEECDTVHVLSDTIDETDIKLDRYLNYFYSKRKIVRIPLRKTSPFNYEYGTQKIMIKSEGETFRVKHIGKYIILDKFIEINAPIEEEKIKNGRNKSNKAKNANNNNNNKNMNNNQLISRRSAQGNSGSKSQRSNR